MPFARILCDESLLFQLLNPSSPARPAPSRLHPWPRALLRISAGLYSLNCVYQNRYDLGIGLMILLSSMRCNSAMGMSYVGQLLKKLSAKGVGYEATGSPLRLTKQASRSILLEMKSGRTVLYTASMHPSELGESQNYTK